MLWVPATLGLDPGSDRQPLVEQVVGLIGRVDDVLVVGELDGGAGDPGRAGGADGAKGGVRNGGERGVGQRVRCEQSSNVHSASGEPLQSPSGRTDS